MTKVSGVRKERTSVISDAEFSSTLDKTIHDEKQLDYYKKRDVAIQCIFKLTGKRVSEVTRLKQNDVQIVGENLSITFTVSKKRKKEMLTLRREKQIPLTDPLTSHIITYQKWMQENIGGQIEWLFPRTHFSPFTNTLTLDKKPLTTRQLLRIVQKYNPDIWCHLYRETAGADIIKQDNSVMAVFKVQKRLDLEKTETAWRYMNRYGVDVINREPKAPKVR